GFGHELDAVELLALVGIAHRTIAQLLQSVALEPVGLVLLVHLFPLRKPGAGNIFQGVLLASVDGEVVIAALAGIHELEIDVLAKALEIAVVPHLKREGGRLAATLFHRPLVHAARGVGVDAVGWAPGNIDMTAVGLPAGFTGGKVVVGVLDAPVMLLAKLVLRRIGTGVAALPEVLDEG